MFTAKELGLIALWVVDHLDKNCYTGKKIAEFNKLPVLPVEDFSMNPETVILCQSILKKVRKEVKKAQLAQAIINIKLKEI